MPQEAAAVEIPPLDGCVILIKWNSPNNINSLDIDHYIVHTSKEADIPMTNETSTLAVFLSPCKDLKTLYINITAVDRCKRVGKPTANFQPRLMVTESSITSTEPLPTTTHTSSQAPACE